MKHDDAFRRGVVAGALLGFSKGDEVNSFSPFEAQLAATTEWGLKWQGHPRCPTCEGTGRITSTKLLELKGEESMCNQNPADDMMQIMASDRVREAEKELTSAIGWYRLRPTNGAAHRVALAHILLEDAVTAAEQEICNQRKEPR